jgi:hypothetical protein
MYSDVLGASSQPKSLRPSFMIREVRKKTERTFVVELEFSDARNSHNTQPNAILIRESREDGDREKARLAREVVFIL